MNSFTHKLLAIIFSIALFTGCASVTDSGLDSADKADIEQPAPTADNPDFGTDQDMEPIVDRPE